MILFLNHKTENCGVYQLGKRMGIALQASSKLEVLYYEVASGHEFDVLISQCYPEMVIYNYYPSTMPWLNIPMLQQYRREITNIAIFHEVPLSGFDFYIHPDPSFVEHDNRFKMGRILPEYYGSSLPPEIMTIGTFGFGLGGKGYPSLVEKVNQEFDEAIINLHIPYAAFGDAYGSGAREWARLCMERVTKPGIGINVSHDFLPEEELLDFLHGNTINAFHYDFMYGRGIASVTDYALAVSRPLAITKSYMFRHIHPLAPEICMEDNSLAEIAARGIEPLRQFMTWDKEHLVADLERIYDTIKDIRSG